MTQSQPGPASWFVSFHLVETGECPRELQQRTASQGYKEVSETDKKQGLSQRSNQGWGYANHPLGHETESIG